MLAYWMIWYCYCFLSGFNCTFLLYSSVFSIAWYGYRYHVTLYIGQQLPRTVFFWVCFVLVLSSTRCSCYYFLDRIVFHHDFHHDSCDYYDYYWEFYGHSLLFKLHFRLSVTKWFWFCKCTTPRMFPPVDFLLEYWIEHVTFRPLCVMFTFPTRIFYRGVPGFATHCPCGVWCHGLTTCLLYAGPLFGNLVENDSRFVSLTYRKTTFCCFWLFHILMPYNMIILYFRLPYFHVLNSALFST